MRAGWDSAACGEREATLKKAVPEFSVLALSASDRKFSLSRFSDKSSGAPSNLCCAESMKPELQKVVLASV
jgi:hypothetical protein